VSLYKAETRRLTKRRFTRWLVLGSLLVLVAIAIGMAFTNQKVGPDQIAAAKAKSEADFQEQSASAVADRQRCEAAKGTAAASDFPPDCAQMYTPTREDFDYRWNMPATFDFRDKFGDLVTAFAAVLGLMAFVIGASYVGAEWNSGGMMNLLLWRPQRLRVLGTKLLALLVGLAALTVVAAAAWTGVFALIANLRGSTASMTSGAWQSFAIMEVRALVAVLVAGAIGFGLASIGRHTALALGAAVGVAVVLQFGLYVVLSMAKVKFAEVLLLPLWAAAWMKKSFEIQDYNSCDFSGYNGCEPAKLTLTWPMAGGLMAIAVVLVVSAAMWTMRSRDIT
jgi:ABC-2 type transport system permease protein